MEKADWGVYMGISEPVLFSIFNATPLHCVIIEMGSAALTNALCSE